MKAIKTLLLVFLLLALPVLVQAQFTFTTNNGAITITDYQGADGKIIVPSETNGWPVTSIAYYALSYLQMTNVVIPDSVTNIAPYAFWSCIYFDHVTIPKSVTSIGVNAFGACGGASGGDGIKIFFQGDKPSMEGGSILGFGALYRLPDTTGWEGAGAILWNPEAQTSGTGFGVGANGFGFNITGTADIPIVVEAAASLADSWVPLQSASLTNGLFYFSDSEWTNYPGRFYRIRSP